MKLSMIRSLSVATATGMLVLVGGGSALASTTPEESSATVVVPEQAAASLRPCNFLQKVDNLHFSGTPGINGALSAHGVWINEDCKATTATLTMSMQKKVGGRWVDVGTNKENKKAYSGGGSSNRASARYDCTGKTKNTFRVWLDVDLNGQVDAPNRIYSVEGSYNCS